MLKDKMNIFLFNKFFYSRLAIGKKKKIKIQAERGTFSIGKGRKG